MEYENLKRHITDNYGSYLSKPLPEELITLGDIDKFYRLAHNLLIQPDLILNFVKETQIKNSPSTSEQTILVLLREMKRFQPDSI